MSGRTIENAAVELPTFVQLAESMLEYAGPRDKSINLKIAINTARMMVAAERGKLAETDPQVLALLKRLNNLSRDWRMWAKEAQTAGERTRLRTCADEICAALKPFEK